MIVSPIPKSVIIVCTGSAEIKLIVNILFILVSAPRGIFPESVVVLFESGTHPILSGWSATTRSLYVSA